MEGKVVKGVIDRCLAKNNAVIVLCPIAEDITFTKGKVKLIELLDNDEKRVIDSQVTKRKL